MIDMGVARPSAQGQAMISTVTAATIPWGTCGAGPQIDQAARAASAAAITAGTNQAATASAVRCTGARLRWALATISTMRASTVSSPTLSAVTVSAPLWLTVPPITLSPGSLVTGRDSPVTMDSSTAERPSVTVPSTATFSPGRTRMLSPRPISSMATSSSAPSGSSRRALRGDRPSRARMAPEVRSRARSSSTWPTSTSTVMTAAASKYSDTDPMWLRKVAGKMSGKTSATVL